MGSKTYPCRPARTRARGEGSGRSFCRCKVDNRFTLGGINAIKEGEKSKQMNEKEDGRLRGK